MLLIKKIKVNIDGEVLFETNKIVFGNEKKVVGLIGENGCGKTTFAEILIGKNSNYIGEIFNDFKTEYIKSNYFSLISSSFKKSGGEEIKKNIFEPFTKQCELLIIDEPNVNIDRETKNNLIKKIKLFKGLLILISHDRDLIKNTADVILEIDKKQMMLYNMSFDQYLLTKENEAKKIKKKFLEYTNKKQKIKKNIEMRKKHAIKSQLKPKNLSFSEWKTSKGGGLNVNKHLGNLNKELENLKKENPLYEWKKHIEFRYAGDLKNNNLIFYDQNKLTFKKGDKILIEGKNGSGKTRLMNDIYQNIDLYKYKVTYIKQNQLISEENLSVESYIKKQTSLNRDLVRSYLAQFKYKEKTFLKKLNELSEGEKSQLNLSLALSKESHILLLDEPTNFLDIKSIQMLEEAIQKFPGSVIVISHDKDFCANINFNNFIHLNP